MHNGVAAILFVLCGVAIVLMYFQLQEKHRTVASQHVQHQEDLMTAAKCLIKSVTQVHPVLKLEEAFQARFLLQNLATYYGGAHMVEKTLRLETNAFTDLFAQVNDQYFTAVNKVSRDVFKVNREYDIGILNNQAGLTLRKTKMSNYPKQSRNSEDNPI